MIPLSATPSQDATLLLSDWQTFIQNGFRWQDFSPRLYRHLIQRCRFIAHFDRRGFWSIYFEQAGPRLVAFLNQFGGDHQAAELGGQGWLDGPGSDLNQALAAEMEAIIEPLLVALDELARQAFEAEKWTEVERLADEAVLAYPHLTRSELVGQLARLYDLARPLDPSQSRFVLTDEMRAYLAQAVGRRPVPAARQPTVFDLHGWLGQEETKAEAEATVRTHLERAKQVEMTHPQTDLARIKERLSAPREVDPHLERRRQRLAAPLEDGGQADAGTGDGAGQPLAREAGHVD